MDETVALKLIQSIKKHEGLKLLSYPDTKGNITIGYGRNLTADGISQSEADILLSNDIANATMDLYKFLPIAQTLDDVRKAVLIEMNFNMGIERLLQFREMLAALKAGDYKHAADEMLNSEWANEVHGRAQDLAFAMESGNL